MAQGVFPENLGKSNEKTDFCLNQTKFVKRKVECTVEVSVKHRIYQVRILCFFPSPLFLSSFLFFFFSIYLHF